MSININGKVGRKAWSEKRNVKSRERADLNVTFGHDSLYVCEGGVSWRATDGYVAGRVNKRGFQQVAVWTE